MSTAYVGDKQDGHLKINIKIQFKWKIWKTQNRNMELRIHYQKYQYCSKAIGKSQL